MQLSDKERARYLQIMKSSLATFVAPEVQSQKARDVVHLLGDLLDEMVLSAQDKAADSQDDISYIEQSKVVLLQMVAALQQRKQTESECGKMKALMDQASGTIANSLMSQWRENSTAIAQSYSKFCADDAKQKKLLVALLAIEQQLYQKLSDLHLNRQPVEAGQVSTGLSIREVTDYLRHCFPQLPDITVTKITPLAGGRSKETTILTIVGGGDELPSQVVMRRDLAESITSGSAADEYEIISAISEQGEIPIPRPYLCEPDNTQLGGSFILLEKARGEKLGDFYPEAQSPKEGLLELGEQQAQILAKLHAFDLNLLAKTKLNSAPDVRTWLTTQIDEIDQRANHYAVDSPYSVSLALAVDWLRDNIELGLNSPVGLLHGDVGLHNQLVENNRVTALLDWEMTTIGPIAKELGACRVTMSHLIPWEKFIEVYQQSGGLAEACEPASVNFYYLLTAATGVSYSKLARHLFNSGATDDITLGHAGLLSDQYGERRLAIALQEAVSMSMV